MGRAWSPATRHPSPPSLQTPAWSSRQRRSDGRVNGKKWVQNVEMINWINVQKMVKVMLGREGGVAHLPPAGPVSRHLSHRDHDRWALSPHPGRRGSERLRQPGRHPAHPARELPAPSAPRPAPRSGAAQAQGWNGTVSGRTKPLPVGGSDTSQEMPSQDRSIWGARPPRLPPRTVRASLRASGVPSAKQGRATHCRRES